MTRREAEYGAIGRVVATFAQARHGAGWTHSDVARDTGLSESSISRIFRADRMSLRAALCFRDAYGIGDLSVLDPGYVFKGRRMAR